MRTLLSWAKSRKWTSAGPPAVSAGIDSGSWPDPGDALGQVGGGDVVASGAHARTLSWAALAELGAFLLPAVPLLALLACLLFGRYPGCEAIVRLSERVAARSRRPRPGAARAQAPLRPASFAPRGGLLLALSLSGRAPPA